MSRSLEQMTLRKKLSETERIVRELIHHLEHGFIPRAHSLRRTARRGNHSEEQHEITDQTVRSEVEKVVVADDFSRQLQEQLIQFSTSIEKDVNQIIGRNS